MPYSVISERCGVDEKVARECWRIAESTARKAGLDEDDAAFYERTAHALIGVLKGRDIAIEEGFLGAILGLRRRLRCRSRKCLHNNKGWCALDVRELTMNFMHRCTRFTRG